jgi:DNA polymerase-1
MITLDAALADVDACIVNTVHDELVVEAAADISEDICSRVEHAMEAAGREYIKSIPVVVDASVADAWMK